MGNKNDIQFIAIFKEHICTICGLCKDPNPSFCTLLYESNTPKFENFIKHVQINKIRPTFINFYSIFCSEQSFCPANSCYICRSFEGAYSCYLQFILQDNKYLSKKTEAKYYEMYSGIDFKDFAVQHMVPKDIDKLGSKKVRRRIRNKLRTAHNLLGKVRNLKRDTRKKFEFKENNVKKVTTSIICNSDPEWKKQIKIYLGE